MRFLVTGVKGQLGYDVVKELKSRGYNDILEYDIQQMDITNKKQVEEVIVGSEPDVVIHCAAYTQVDKAEDNEELARKIKQALPKTQVYTHPFCLLAKYHLAPSLNPD